MADHDDDLPAGLYERLITRSLGARLLRFDPSRTRVVRKPIDPAEAHATLARHVERVVAQALRGLSEDDRVARQTELSNELIRLLGGNRGLDSVAGAAGAEGPGSGRVRRRDRRRVSPRGGGDVSAVGYRTSFEKPAPIEPAKVLEYRWSLHTQNYTFKKGHRVMVQVQSTWFPIIDRNLQTFVKNIFEAKESDFKAATHRVYRSGLSVARRRSGGPRICHA